MLRLLNLLRELYVGFIKINILYIYGCSIVPHSQQYCVTGYEFGTREDPSSSRPRWHQISLSYIPALGALQLCQAGPVCALLFGSSFQGHQGHSTLDVRRSKTCRRITEARGGVLRKPFSYLVPSWHSFYIQFNFVLISLLLLLSDWVFSILFIVKPLLSFPALIIII